MGETGVDPVGLEIASRPHDDARGEWESTDTQHMTLETEAQEVESFYNDEDFDPTESDETNLDEVPDQALIAFRSGRQKNSVLSFIIERAMIDPDAEVMPN